ncbi:MAG: hypothetical protein AAF086_01250 [Planctomycetota bacterium]
MTEKHPADFPSPPDASAPDASPPDAETDAHAAENSESPTSLAAEPAPAAALPDDLLSILVCPLTRSQLRQDGDWLIATSPINAGLRYPIRNGIPVLLIDEATLPDSVASLDEFKSTYADAIPG